MQKATSYKFLGRLGATYLMATVLFAQLPLQALADSTLAVTLTANGQTALTLATSTATFTIDLTTANATACQQTSPVASGIAVNTSMTIAPGHPFYPAIGGNTTFTVTCTDGTNNQTASVIVSLPAASTGGSSGSGSGAGSLSVTLTANGSTGPVTLNPGDTYTYTWTSTNATACQQTSPIASGISTSGTSSSIAAGHPFYPTATSSVTLTVTCTDGVNNASASVVVKLAVPSGVTVDIKANGSDGPVTLAPGATYTYTWTSTNATACQQTSPIASGISISGTSGIIGVGHPFYPSTTTPVTLTITCTDGVNNATDSVVVGLASASAPGPVTVDIKANGSDGPVNLNQGDTYVYTWTSTNATACQQTSPIASGISTVGTSSPIAVGHPFYPAVGSPVTLTIVCTNGVANASDSVIVNLLPAGGGGPGPSCSVATISSALTATATVSSPFSYVITTTNASTSPSITVATSSLPTGLTYASSTQTISGTPTTAGTYNVSIVSTNLCGPDTKTLVITVNAPAAVGGGPLPTGPAPLSSGGGGGGISLSAGGRHGVLPPASSNDQSCLYLKDYMRRDFNNDPVEVAKLQTFLRDIEGYNYVSVNGVFDQATVDAVDAFQMKYKDDILTPWGHTAPTHYVYILTLKKINELYCLHSFPLNDAQQKEIIAFRALLEGLHNQGLPVVFTPGTTTIKDISTTTATSVPVELPIVGQLTPQGQNIRNLAAVIFTGPAGLLNALQCIYEFLLILIVLYILGSVLEDVLYEDIPENVLKKFLTKWTVISLGLTLAIIGAYIFKEWCLILPLLIVLILSLLWMALYPRHAGIKSSTKAWYLVLTARSKSLFNKARVIEVGPAEERK